MKNYIAQLSITKKVLAIAGFILIAAILLILAFRIAYIGRIYPGITANGVYVGGLTKQEAMKAMSEQANAYQNKVITVTLPQGDTTVSADSLGAQYNSELAAESAFKIGRENDLLTSISAQTLALFGQVKPINSVSLDSNKTSYFLVTNNNASAKSVENSKFIISGSDISIAEAARGRRIDFARASTELANHFAQLSDKELVLPSIIIEPSITSQTLLAHKDLFTKMVTTPLIIQAGQKSWTIDANQASAWLAASGGQMPVKTDILNNFYPSQPSETTIYFDRKAITEYLNAKAVEINVEPVNAKLTVSGGKAVVFAQSKDGQTLQIEPSTNMILAALNNAETEKPVLLTVITTKADVSDENIDKLGITDLLSEGVTYFPGSPPNRLQNVRVGAKQFNGVLLKPGEIFSFGQLLGDVGPEQGYTPGLVILGDHEEKQYGGGLCQVSSTAFRAALLAGLPILQRTNHAFAISYYTAPYGVPGVDATIFYPAVDFKFRNDTGHYILIETEMSGTTLKFRYYGTKAKSGNIRGPYFVSGSNDETKPSQTVFYRDVLDSTGSVVKTDTFNTYYKSSLDFPVSD